MLNYRPSITRLMERTTNCASRSRSSPVIHVIKDDVTDLES